MFFDDENCTAHDVGGNLGGPCDCARCDRAAPRFAEPGAPVSATVVDYLGPNPTLTNPRYLDGLLEDVKARLRGTAALVTLSDVQDGIAELARERDAFRDLTTYDHRSEFARLKKADVDQGRRIAELEAEVKRLKYLNELERSNAHAFARAADNEKADRVLCQQALALVEDGKLAVRAAMVEQQLRKGLHEAIAIARAQGSLHPDEAERVDVLSALASDEP